MDESNGKHHYKMTVAYDGTNYSGWQIQPNGVSIQELLEKYLKLLTRKEVHVHGAGRTDAGVHALGQMAHFSIDALLDLRKVHYSLNGLLPKDIRVEAMAETTADFHARYSAVGKTYHYHLHLDPVESPFHRRYRWHVPQKIYIPLLEEAAHYFLGTRDFSSFSNEAHRGAAARNAVRTLHRLDVIPQEGGVRLEFYGDGFLYKMVRNIVGTLVEVGKGKYLPTEMPGMLARKDRTQAGQAAPALGLFLVSVHY